MSSWLVPMKSARQSKLWFWAMGSAYSYGGFGGTDVSSDSPYATQKSAMCPELAMALLASALGFPNVFISATPPGTRLS